MMNSVKNLSHISRVSCNNPNQMWGIIKMSKSKLGSLVALVATSSLVSVSSVSANPSGTQLIQNMNRDALISNPATLQNTNAQVTSISQFSDVQPTDWAFTALQSLVERYGCIAGYPNATFRGNRALSRFEFAAGLNACLDKINELISEGLADKVGREDLATLQRLQEEFTAELAALRGRVTALEAKTNTLEAQQFSTTTKLTGSAIFALANSFGDSPISDTTERASLGGRARLNFQTSFTGRDLLTTRLQAGNIQNNSTSNLTRLAFDNPGTANQNVFILDNFWYRFPLGSQVNVVVGTNSTDVDNVLDVVNPNLASAEQGALSRFARRDPLVFRGQEGAGAGVQIRLNEQFAANFAYLASNASVPGGSVDAGLFGGGYSASAQLLYRPISPWTLSFVYQRGYDPVGLNLTNSTGTPLAANPATGGLFATGASSDRFGFQTNFDFSPNFSFNGRISYANVRSVDSGSTADILTWLVSASFRDLFGSGDQATLAFGQPPYVVGGNVTRVDGTQNPYHLEAFYRFRVSRNISITPGLITIFNPGVGNPVNNATAFVGVLRTSFTF